MFKQLCATIPDTPKSKRFQFVVEGPTFPNQDCFRDREGKFGTGGTDPRDIVEVLPPLNINLNRFAIGQYFRLRNGKTGWLQSIRPGKEDELRFNISGVMYFGCGRTSQNTSGPLDILEPCSPGGAEDASKSSADSTPKLNLKELPIGTALKRRDKVIVRILENNNAGDYPVKARIASAPSKSAHTTDTYMSDGMYIKNQPNNPKDIVEVLSTPRTTPMSVASALKALRVIITTMSKANADKAKALVDFVEKSVIKPCCE